MLAMVWAPFVVRIGGKVTNCGIDHFDLVRENGTWKDNEPDFLVTDHGLPHAMMKSLLIANRGEIACRIIRTARRLGIRTVAVYSDADAKALHVRMADEAVHIGPARRAKAISSARRSSRRRRRPARRRSTRATASSRENADFAQAVIDAGLIWVGPKPDSIRAMGLKDAAKKLMAEAGVPVTPGYLGEDQDPKRLQEGGRRDRLSGADQGGRGRRRQGHAPGRCRPATSTTRSKAASARRRARSATTAC